MMTTMHGNPCPDLICIEHGTLIGIDLSVIHVERQPLCSILEIQRLPADAINLIPARVRLGQVRYQSTTLHPQVS